MLILASTTDKIQLITASAGFINVHASYLDNVSGAIGPGRQNTAITSAITTDIVNPPGAATQRNVKTLYILNRATAGNDVTLQHSDGTTVVQLHKLTLPPNGTLQYLDEVGFGLSGESTLITTGDAKITLKSVADPGWVLMNDGTIGDALSGGTARADNDCQGLFSLLWTNISQTWAPVTGGRGASAGADWAAHKVIALTKQLGRAIAVSGTGSGLTGRAPGSFDGAETHALTIAELAPHSHTLNDPWHNHTVYDPTHSHPYESAFNQAVGGTGVQSAAVEYGTSTGGAYTGISLGSAPTGISIANNGSGTPMSLLSPRAYWNVMIKL